jgi:radical SAM protein with 4Fe4S-binding SPASM domain
MPAETGWIGERLGALRRWAQWRAHELELAALRRAHPLRYLFLEVTRRCNLACAYCGSACGPEAQGSELSLDEWIRVARQIAEDFDPSQVMVAVTGGEPLMKKGVLELMEELGRLGFPFGMVTNGHLLTPEAAERLVSGGMTSLSLSLDAPGELNDTLRGEGSAWAVERAVNLLRAAGFRGLLEIITTVTTPALEQLSKMREHVARMKVERWRLAPVMPIGRAAGRPELVPDASGILRLLEFVRASRDDGLLPSPQFCDEGFLGKRYEGKVRPYLGCCLSGITIGGVLHDGRIGACPELGDAFVQGDIRHERFSEVWDQRYQALRDRGWTRKGECARCPEFRRCQGGALHLYPTPQDEPLRCLYLMAGRGRAG